MTQCRPSSGKVLLLPGDARPARTPRDPPFPHPQHEADAHPGEHDVADRDHRAGPTRTPRAISNRPKTWSSQSTTATTTTMLMMRRIFGSMIDPAYVFSAQSNTPITTRTTTSWMSSMGHFPMLVAVTVTLHPVHAVTFAR